MFLLSYKNTSDGVFSLGYFLMNNVTSRKKQLWKVLRTHLKQVLLIRTVFYWYSLDGRRGGLMVSQRSSPDWAVRLPTLARDVALCSWARHVTLTRPFFIQVYNLVPASLMLGVSLYATETGISSGLMGHLARMLNLPLFSWWEIFFLSISSIFLS